MRKNIAGQRSGKLVAISDSGKADSAGQRIWLCKCDCGRSKYLLQGNFGRRKSCGCTTNAQRAAGATRHKMSRTLFYGVWRGMHDRCYNKKHSSWKLYGGRGIKVGLRWHSFENFTIDMLEEYRESLTLERVNNDKDYVKSNCVWANRKVQAYNRRSAHWVDTPWGKLQLKETALRIGITNNALLYRLKNWQKNRWFEPKGKVK